VFFLLLEHAASSVTAAMVGATTIQRRRLPVGKLKLMVTPHATGPGREEPRPAANADIVSLSAEQIKRSFTTNAMYTVTVWYRSHALRLNLQFARARDAVEPRT
jgi:hypothetical protein